MEVLNLIKTAMEKEFSAIKELTKDVGSTFEEAVRMIQDCEGKVVVTGVGKSGHIGKKIAATFASTGTPAFFLHSTEGVHGDLGMIQSNDVVLMISNSGETQEVINLLPSLRRIGSKRIVITSKPDSSLANSSDVALIYQFKQEVDHLGLAPTTSSTLALVIGDALAVTLSELKEFENSDFYLYHPGGSLGEQLSSKLQQRK